MIFQTPYKEGRFIKRYKRFLVDVEQENGERMTVHCPNTGAMRGLLIPGAPVLLSSHANPQRKYPHTLEAVAIEGVWVGVNTMLPNRFVAHCLQADLLPELKGYTGRRSEVPYDQNARIDFLLEAPGRATCYLEVKNVHDKEGQKALFPDSPTTRGVKHLNALTRVAQAGHRAVVLYIVQRSDIVAFDLNALCDPAYVAAAQVAIEAGVETYAYACHLDASSIELKGRLWCSFLDNAKRDIG